MKLKQSLFILVLVLVVGCTSKISRLTAGYYESVCFLQRYPDVILQLSDDQSFKYKFAYLEDNLIGEWELHADTLFLTSNYFNEEFQKPMTPSRKYTEFSNKEDAFLLKGKRLYKLDSLGQVNYNCYLKRRN